MKKPEFSIKYFIFSGLLLSVLIVSCKGNKGNGASDSTKTVDTVIRNSNIDPAPDTLLTNYLANLPDVSKEDTSAKNQVIDINGRKISFALFFTLRKFLRKKQNPFAATQEYQIMSNQTTAQQKLSDLIASFRDRANFMTSPFNFTGNPLQNKIVYSWGSKQYSSRATPPGEDDYCKYKIHGVDCSGFIYQLFVQSGLTMDSTKACSFNEHLRSFLQKSLDPYFGVSKYLVTDMGKISTKQMISGDLLYFKNDNDDVVHIAIALVDKKGHITYYASLGGPIKNTKSGIIDLSKCRININPKHGIVSKVLDQAFQDDKRDYGVVRISVP